MTKILETLNITPSELIRFNLARIMRAHRVTISALAAHMGVSQDRVRFIRTNTPRDFLIRVDYIQAVRELAR